VKYCVGQKVWINVQPNDCVWSENMGFLRAYIGPAMIVEDEKSNRLQQYYKVRTPFEIYVRHWIHGSFCSHMTKDIHIKVCCIEGAIK
jgi:hypothetical protein